jgi:hypothetical protein
MSGQFQQHVLSESMRGNSWLQPSHFLARTLINPLDCGSYEIGNRIMFGIVAVSSSERIRHVWNVISAIHMSVEVMPRTKAGALL